MFRRKLWILIVLLFFFTCGLFFYVEYFFSLDSKIELVTKDVPIINLGEWDNGSLVDLIKEAGTYETISERIDYISSKFLETRYGPNTLVGSEISKEALIVNLEEVDCFTFLDYTLALAIAENLTDFYNKLKLVRYDAGIVDFTKRNHFFTQWINNKDYFLNVSDSFENSNCILKELNKKIDGYWVEGITPFEKNICYISKEEILKDAFYQELRSGDIVGFYTNSAGLDVTHVGIISIQNFEFYLRHASIKYNKVVDEDLKQYLIENNYYDGLIIVRINNN